jgi:hypothetical protein
MELSGLGGKDLEMDLKLVRELQDMGLSMARSAVLRFTCTKTAITGCSRRVTIPGKEHSPKCWGDQMTLIFEHITGHGWLRDSQESIC